MFQNSKLAGRRIRFFAGSVFFLCFLSHSAFAANSSPQIVSLTPVTGSSKVDTQVVLNTTFSDADGAQDITSLGILFGTVANVTSGFSVLYTKATNRLIVVEGKTFSGGFAPGSGNLINAKYISVDCSKTLISAVGNTLTVSWALTFKDLASGPKFIYLIAQDSSRANTGWLKKGGWVITPAETEIRSADGKIRLLIPQGALSSGTTTTLNSISSAQSISTLKIPSLPVLPIPKIKIAQLKIASIRNLSPSGMNMLCAGEFSPNGLRFSKAATLIFTLDQAEVPGTLLRLGLYDPLQRRYVFSNGNAQVGADGYTASFKITHFSSYAVFKSLVSSGAPIGAGVKIPLPDLLTGAYGQSIPLTVVPGRKGMQPSLALNYRSSNGNSWIGMGLSLNPGYIIRSTRLGPAAYDDIKDTFYLITDAGTTELVHLVDNVYQSKIESSFTKFYKQIDDTWRVVGKDGSVLRFGQDLNVKEVSGSGTFAWYLTKAVDTNANFIQYNYIKDQGKCYLSGIDYTGNDSGLSPENHIEFTLESRNDNSSSYISTSRIAIAKRLKEIQVRVGSDLAWRYELEYVYSPDTNRSLLKSITQFGSDNKSMPVQRFDYQKAN